jgi:radical SAM protein with 4Fe4S-binding SPASM domain
MSINNFNKYVDVNSKNPFGSQAKMFIHADRVGSYITTGDTAPIFMELNLTDKCNLQCSWCISDNRGASNTLNADALLKFNKEFYEMGGKAVTFSGGGEPTLHRSFIRLAKETKKIGLDLGLMTNGLFNKRLIGVIDDCFKWIRVSVDFVDPKKYKASKGVDGIKIVKDNILNFKKTKVGVNCNVSSQHEKKDIDNLLYAFDSRVSYIQFRPVLPRYFKNEKPEINDRIWDYLHDIKEEYENINISLDKYGDLMDLNYFPFDSCEGHFFSPILDANGDVKVCMYHPGKPEFSFGNIYKNSFEEIWKSERRKKVIDFVRNLDYNKKCQMCCKLCELNKLITFVNNPPEEIDKNFL